MTTLAAAAVAEALAVAKQKAEGGLAVEDEYQHMALDEGAGDPPWGPTTASATASAHPAGSIAAILAAIAGGKGAVGKGGGRGTSGFEARHRRLMLQMEARLRTVEDIVMITVKAPLTLPPMSIGLLLTHFYQTATTASPTDHQLGGPDAFVGGGFLRTLAAHPLPNGADATLRAHHAALKALASWSGRLTPTMNAMWIHHLSVWALPDPQKAEGLVQYAFEGTISMPTTAEQTAQCCTALDHALRTGEATPTEIQDLFFTVDVGTPVHAGHRGKEIDKVVLAVLCAVGGSRQTKPGRGTAARAVKGKGKGT